MFEIVQTGPEGEGKQPYFLRHTAGNSEKVVHSENYAHRAGAEGAYIAIAKDFIPIRADQEFDLVWNEDRTAARLHVDGWTATHQKVRFVKEFEDEPPAKKTTTKKAAAKKTAASTEES